MMPYYLTLCLLMPILGFIEALGMKYDNTSSARILGSSATAVADIATYPWMASIQVDGINIGSAIIVGSHWVLTTASTATDIASKVLTNEVKIKFGSLDVSATGSTAQSRHIKNNIVSYPTFNPTTKEMDIALIQICPGFTGSQIYAPLGVTTPPLADSVIGVVLGWGDHPTQLKELGQTVDTDSTCSTTASVIAASLPWEADDFCTILLSANGVCNDFDKSAPFIFDSKVAGILREGGCGTSPETYLELTPTIVSWIQTEAANNP